MTHLDEDDSLDMYYLIPDMFNKTLIQKIFDINNISNIHFTYICNSIIIVDKEFVKHNLIFGRKIWVLFLKVSC